MPAGPAPTTAISFAAAQGVTGIRVSWQARGFTRQEVILPTKIWSRQAWLQAMQVLMLSAAPRADLLTKAASARNGRASDTISAQPLCNSCSATCGWLMRLVAITGAATCWRSRRAAEAKAARGTEVAMVGTRASCQPMPVLNRVTPLFSSAVASVSVSSSELPSSTRSSIDRRKITIKSRPTASRTARVTASANA